MPKPNNNSHLMVVNVEGTSWDVAAQNCGCSSWIAHWRRNTKTKRLTCMATKCARWPEVGAHVMFADGRRDQSVQIIGLCRACNIHHNRAPFPIDRRTTGIVLAEWLSGCGDE